MLEYNFETIKIDRFFFVSKLTGENNQVASSVIQAIMSIANTFKFKVIAEGAETKEQVDKFRLVGCHLVQGFYFYKPLEWDKVKSLVEE